MPDAFAKPRHQQLQFLSNLNKAHCQDHPLRGCLYGSRHNALLMTETSVGILAPPPPARHPALMVTRISGERHCTSTSRQHGMQRVACLDTACVEMRGDSYQ